MRRNFGFVYLKLLKTDMCLKIISYNIFFKNINFIIYALWLVLKRNLTFRIPNFTSANYFTKCYPIWFPKLKCIEHEVHKHYVKIACLY